MNFRTLVAAGAIAVSGIAHAQVNHTFGKPVGERGGPFGIGVEQPGIPPNVITDGAFFQDVPFEAPPEDPITWNKIGSWWMDSECSDPPPEEGQPPTGEPCWLEIDLMDWFIIDSFIFQGDSDAYLVQYWVEEPPHWEDAWKVPSMILPDCIQTEPDPPAACIGTRPNPADNSERWYLDEAIATNRLRVQADYGGAHNGYYAVTELQAFGPDPCTAAGGTPVDFGCDYEESERETHVATDETCYRLELTCDGDVSGGFGACVHPNEFIDFHMGGQVGFPHPPNPGEPECAFGGMHVLNEKVEHSCWLDGQGSVRLEAKQVDMDRCDGQE